MDYCLKCESGASANISITTDIVTVTAITSLVQLIPLQRKSVET
ncbi:MAG: hypothetical protein AAFV85_19340 [Cyanobacteria bacterium J06634_6]